MECHDVGKQGQVCGDCHKTGSKLPGRYSQIDDRGNGETTSIANLNEHESEDPNVRLHAVKVVANLAAEGCRKALIPTFLDLNSRKSCKLHKKQFLEPMVIPNVVGNEDFKYSFDQSSMEFSQCIKQSLAESREMQKNLEARIRKKMRKFGDKKHVILNSPINEIVKGFPEVEMKWMFGDKEVVVPKASRAHLFHGWKKWRDEAKTDLKTKLLEDEEFGKQYVAQKQERILLDRDRVSSRTWYNEERKKC